MGWTVERRRALRCLTALLRRGLVTDADGDELVRLYARVFDAAGIAIAQHYGFSPWCAQAGIPPTWAEAHTRLQHEDPAPQFFAANPSTTPFVMASAFGPGMARREIFHELHHVAGFVDGIVQRVAAPRGGDVFVVVYRARGQRAVSTEDATIAELLHPHLAGALCARSALAALSGGAASRASHDGHAFVAFPSLEVVLSAEARRTWTREAGPVSEAGWRQVRKLVGRAALEFMRCAPGSRSRMILPTLRAELAWVPPRRGETHRALVLFLREPRPRARLAAPVAELLSPRQRRVVELAATGALNPAIAAALGVSPETVRTHLRAALRRLGVSRRGELAPFLTTDPLDGS